MQVFAVSDSIKTVASTRGCRIWTTWCLNCLRREFNLPGLDLEKLLWSSEFCDRSPATRRDSTLSVTSHVHILYCTVWGADPLLPCTDLITPPRRTLPLLFSSSSPQMTMMGGHSSHSFGRHNEINQEFFTPPSPKNITIFVFGVGQT